MDYNNGLQHKIGSIFISHVKSLFYLYVHLILLFYLYSYTRCVSLILILSSEIKDFFQYEAIVGISSNFYRRHLRAHRSSCWTYMLTSLGFSKGLRRNPTDGALACSDQPNDATTSP